jgi:hypothetical protein
MIYSIFSERGNLVDAFEDESAAISAYKAILASEPEASDVLNLVAQDDDGNFVESPAIEAALTAVA